MEELGALEALEAKNEAEVPRSIQRNPPEAFLRLLKLILR